ncbi:hypothetical protein CAPTEDRAFT_189042 [Capitella teleta]|uniref:Uncharacterized protein n=1 Tax=Capitella teleta TaxID=283909 RepID=R7UN86_CAPTE|nr:hypothetical protein CAPTEDRAFT_189042 [Capitella teleta]|eukprot:ELU07675.1 hypothetical protein CAPTEDRAFT_189042 [Capitella teleta]
MTSWNGAVGETTKTSLKLTSIKGVPRVFKVESSFLVALWIFFIFGYFCIAVYLVENQKLNYYEYPTVIDYDEKIPDDEMMNTTTVFPALLLCNLKPVHIEDNATVIGLMDYLAEVSVNMTRYRRQNVGGMSKGKERKVDAVFSQLYKTQGFLEFIGWERALQYGQTFEQFVVSCLLTSNLGNNVYPCSQVAIISTVTSPHFFNCYTIKLNSDAIKELSPLKFSVILHMGDADDYVHTSFSQVSNDLQSSGVIIQPFTDTIDTQTKGLGLRPGTLSSVHFTMAQRIRRGRPYDQCDVAADEPLYKYITGEPVPYSTKRCTSACIQTVVSEECKCLRSDIHAVHRLEELELPFCGAPRQTFDERIASVLCSLDAPTSIADECNSKCRTQCESMSVISQVSSSKWPRHSQKLGFYKTAIVGRSFENEYPEFKKLNDELTSENVPEVLEELRQLDRIEKNFLKVETIMTDPTIRVTTTKAKISYSDLISSIASFMNMFSGITLIVVVEFFDYIIHLIYAAMGKRNHDEEGTVAKRPEVVLATNYEAEFSVRL